MMPKPKVKKQSLYDALVGALGSVVTVLEPYVRSGKVPREPITEARSRPEGGYVHKHYHRRDYSTLAVKHSKEWGGLPAIEKAIQALAGDADVQKDFSLVGFGNLHDYVTTQIVHQFICKILYMTRRWPPSRSSIDTLFIEFEDYLLGATVSCEATIPLQNFECESKKLVLEQDIAVRKLSDREKESFVSRATGGWSIENVMETMRHQYAAVLRFSWAKGNTLSHYQDKIGKLLTALRLFKIGGVGANVAYKREPTWQPGHIVGGAERHIYSVPVVGPTYTLDRWKTKAFVKFWKWLYQRPISDSAEVAIRWFNHGYEDWIPEDRVVSFVTGFESLFLRKGERKRRNLVNRIPRLLTDPVHRSSVEQSVEAIWDLRSNVVHAGSYQPAEAIRLAEVAEGYLRLSIGRYIELERQLIPNTRDDILKWLDSPAVDSNKQMFFPHWQAI